MYRGGIKALFDLSDGVAAVGGFGRRNGVDKTHHSEWLRRKKQKIYEVTLQYGKTRHY